MMRSFIKRILPKSVLVFIKKIKHRIDIFRMYSFDRRRLLKHAYSLNKQYTHDNLRAKITFHYHSIEKGLSNFNLRLGFGKRALNELFWAMDEYLKNDYPKDDFRFQSAISVLLSYISLHKMNDFSVDWVEQRVAKYLGYLIDEYKDIGGYKVLSLNELPDFSKLGFKDLVSNRYSVRDFGSDLIDDLKVFDAIDIASKSPSVCNRQAWKVRYVKSPSKIKAALAIQEGLTGNGENLRGLLVITVDKQYMNSGYERNQTYIDGGIFTMSLLYALTSVRIASCTLNASFDLSKEFKMRPLLNMGDSEDFIAILAIGSFPERFKIAKSPKDSYKYFTSVIE